MAGQELTFSMTADRGAGEKMTESELRRDISGFQPMLYRIAFNYLGSHADCDDVMQEVFIKLYYRGQRFESAEAKKAWLIRVTVNCCKSRLLHWWNKKRADMPETAPADDAVCPELSEALSQLRPAYRTVIYLHYYEGFSVSEISELLGISVTAVTTRLQRGRKKLKEMLDD